MNGEGGTSKSTGGGTAGTPQRGTESGHGQGPRRGRAPWRKRGNGRGNGRPPRPSFAALDLGTNNCRLLVAQPQNDTFKVVDAFSRIVRLGEGLEESGALSEEAITRSISALRVCAKKMRRNRVRAARAVATEACRRASNCDEFVSRVKSETGVELEIITSGEEARLALAGCTSLLDKGIGRALVFDIGGGSTELIWIGICEKGEAAILDTISLPCGVVNFAELYGGHEVCRNTYTAMADKVEEMLRPFEDSHRISEQVATGAVQMLGTSGTVTTLAALHQNLPRYDRSKVDGCFMSFEDLATVRDSLTEMDYEARARLACIGRDRADLVLAGAAILDAICRVWDVGSLRVADRGLREGILLGLMGAESGPAPVV